MKLRRRDLLLALGCGVGALAAVKVGGRWWLGPDPSLSPRAGRSLNHLSGRQEVIATAIARVMVGRSGQIAIDAGTWDPAASFDRLLDSLSPDQRSTAGIALHLFEEWTPGFTSFTRAPRDEQERRLAAWATSDLALHRTVWGLLHAAFGSGFAGSRPGMQALGHLGPTVVGAGHPGRPPGQTIVYTWDELVP